MDSLLWMRVYFTICLVTDLFLVIFKYSRMAYIDTTLDRASSTSTASSKHAEGRKLILGEYNNTFLFSQLLVVLFIVVWLSYGFMLNVVIQPPCMQCKDTPEMCKMHWVMFIWVIITAPFVFLLIFVFIFLLVTYCCCMCPSEPNEDGN